MNKPLCREEQERRFGAAWMKLDEARQILESTGIELVTDDGHRIEIGPQMDRVFRLAKMLKEGNSDEEQASGPAEESRAA